MDMAMTRAISVAALLTLVACQRTTPDRTTSVETASADTDSDIPTDRDGDGFDDESVGGEDCDDLDAAIHPDATEVCDQLDNDCDGRVDLDDDDLDPTTLVVFYEDSDGDGYGKATVSKTACTAPHGFVDNDIDCYDQDDRVHPAAIEVCNGHDDDCNGLVDDDDPAVDASNGDIFHADADGDGLGDPVEVPACERPPGHVNNSDDCDDADPLVAGPSLWLEDLDGDDFGVGPAVGPLGCVGPGPTFLRESYPEDCDDADPGVHPAVTEVCEDGVDNDCDGVDQSCTSILYLVNDDTDSLQTFNADTGAIADVGSLGTPFGFGDIAWDSTNDVLYMIDGRGDYALHTVDITTGHASQVGVHGLSDLIGLAYDPSTDRLFATRHGPDGFYEMNRNTGAAVLIGVPGAGYDDLTYLPSSDLLVAIEPGTGAVGSIDRTTGVDQFLNSPGWIDNYGLAWEPDNDVIWAFDYRGDVYQYDPVTFDRVHMGNVGSSIVGATWIPN